MKLRARGRRPEPAGFGAAGGGAGSRFADCGHQHQSGVPFAAREQAYFVNIPSKFISSDGRTVWLCYAANFKKTLNGQPLRSDPPGGAYGMVLQEVRLLAR